MDLLKLQDKFAPQDIEWRLGRVGMTKSGKLYGTALAYITNRAIMHRLDMVCGPENWRNEFREWNVGAKRGVLCGLSIRINGEWVTKWDGAENTDIEALKGGLSDSMKRAGVQWGIGRYLYDLDENFAIIDEAGSHYAAGVEKSSGKPYRFRWSPPRLPVWALPTKEEQTTAAEPLPARRLTQKTPALPEYTLGQAPAGKRP